MHSTPEHDCKTDYQVYPDLQVHVSVSVASVALESQSDKK